MFMAEEGTIWPALSPDGHHIVYSGERNGQRALLHLDIATDRCEVLGQPGYPPINALFWKGNDTILFQTPGPSRSAVIGAFDIPVRPVRLLTGPSPLPALCTIAGQCPGLPDKIVIEDCREGGSVLKKIDVHTGTSELIYKSAAYGKRPTYLVTATGQLAFSTVADEPKIIHLDHPGIWSAKSHSFVVLKDVHLDKAYWRLGGCTSDGVVYLINSTEGDFGVLRRFDPADAGKSTVAYAATAGELTSAIFSPDGARLLGVNYLGPGLRQVWFEADRLAMQKHLEQLFPGAHVFIVSSSLDEKMHVLSVGSDRTPEAFYLFDSLNDKTRLLGRTAAVPGELPVPETHPVDIPASDGLVLHGFIVTPAGGAKDGAALVIRPYDQPFDGRFFEEPDGFTRYLTSRGFVVLNLNCRGCTGYGQKYLYSGSGELSGHLVTDVTDAASWCVQQGKARPGRIALCGEGMAGGIVLVAAAQKPALFCAVVNRQGVVDWGHLVEIDERAGRAAAHPLLYGPNFAIRHRRTPVDLVTKLPMPVLNFYSSRLSPNAVESLGHAYAAAKKQCPRGDRPEDYEHFDPVTVARRQARQAKAIADFFASAVQ